MKSAKFAFAALIFGLSLQSPAFAVTPCCRQDVLQQAADTPEFAAAHPLKVSEETKPLQGTMLRLSDFGAEDVAYLSLPTVPPKGGVILIHEWWGLNDHIKAVADQIAALGYIALAVDVYNGKSTTDPVEAAQYMKDLRMESALKTVHAGIRLLRESPRFQTTSVAVLGWCMGGGVSLQSAIHIPGIDAAVIYYGPVETDVEQIKKINIPILGIYGTQDQWVTKESVDGFAAQMQALNKPFDLHYFDAPHAFANPSNAKYDPVSAAKAWDLTVDFLSQHLGQTPKPQSLFDKIFKKKDKPDGV